MTRYLIGAVVFSVAGLAGYFLAKSQRSTAPALTAAPKADAPPGSEGAPVDGAGQKLQKSVPDLLPDITLANPAGKPTPLATYAGRPLMVNFWATWCAPCRREIPLLNKIRRERKAQNGEIVGIAVDFREDVLRFVQKVPLEYPLLIGEEDGLAATEAFGMGMAFPFSVFVDSQNRILTIKIGELHEDEANFAFDRLRDIDNGVMTRVEAQSAVAEAFKEMAAARALTEPAETKPAS